MLIGERQIIGYRLSTKAAGKRALAPAFSLQAPSNQTAGWFLSLPASAVNKSLIKTNSLPNYLANLEYSRGQANAVDLMSFTSSGAALGCGERRSTPATFLQNSERSDQACLPSELFTFYAFKAKERERARERERRSVKGRLGCTCRERCSTALVYRLLWRQVASLRVLSQLNYGLVPLDYPTPSPPPSARLLIPPSKNKVILFCTFTSACDPWAGLQKQTEKRKWKSEKG